MQLLIDILRQISNALTNLRLFSWTSRRADVVLLFVTASEEKALWDTLGRRPPSFRIQGKDYFDLGIIKGARVVAARSGKGSVTRGGSLATVKNCVRDLRPNTIILLGIAFGVHDDICERLDIKKKRISLGDILVSRRIIPYEPQKLRKDKLGNRYPISADRVPAPPHLVERFRTAEGDWSTGARIHFGDFLSGEKLFDDEEFLSELLRQEPDAIGGDMEGAGLYSAAEDDNCDWIVVKAVSDWGFGKDMDDEGAIQHKAAKNSAKFVLHTLQNGGFAGGCLSIQIRILLVMFLLALVTVNLSIPGGWEAILRQIGLVMATPTATPTSTSTPTATATSTPTPAPKFTPAPTSTPPPTPTDTPPVACDKITVAISEVMLIPMLAIPGDRSSGSYYEYVELANYGSEPINVGGMFIADRGGHAGMIVSWRDVFGDYPIGKANIDTTEIQPGGYAVILPQKYVSVMGQKPYGNLPKDSVVLTLDGTELIGDGLIVTQEYPLDVLVLFIGTPEIIECVVSTYGTPRLPLEGIQPSEIQDVQDDGFPVGISEGTAWGGYYRRFLGGADTADNWKWFYWTERTPGRPNPTTTPAAESIDG